MRSFMPFIVGEIDNYWEIVVETDNYDDGRYSKRHFPAKASPDICHGHPFMN